MADRTVAATSGGRALVAASPSRAIPRKSKPLHIGVRTARCRVWLRQRVAGQTQPGHCSELGSWHSTSAAVNLAFYLAGSRATAWGWCSTWIRATSSSTAVYSHCRSACRWCSRAILGTARAVSLAASASALDDLSHHLRRRGLSLMILFAASTFVRYEAESRLTLIFAWGLMTMLVVLGRAAICGACGALHRRGVGVAPTLVVGDSTVGRMIMQALTDRPHLGYAVAGFLATEGDGDFGRFRRLGTPG